MKPSSSADELISMPFSISSVARALTSCAAAIAVAVTAGCAGPGEESTSSPPEPVQTTSSSASAPSQPSVDSSPSSATASNEAMLAAGRLAAKKAADSTVVSIESERDGWEVHVVTDDGGEQEFRIDPSGKTVISGPTDDRPDADDKAENKQFSAVDVDFAKAVEVVSGEVKDGRIKEIGLDTDNRRVVWEADVIAGSEQRTVQLDAGSGDVLSNRLDD